MQFSEQNTQSVQALLSTGLFETESHVADAAMRYAFRELEDVELDLDTEAYMHLQALSEKTGVSMSFLMNRIVERHLQNPLK